MNMKELAAKTPKERSQLLHELRLKVQEIRFALSVGKKQNVKELREAKKTIARVNTIHSARGA